MIKSPVYLDYNATTPCDPGVLETMMPYFSTNFGIGLKYGFMKSFEFNVEPTFKYQLNTFSSDAGNFKPYLFGIYSGISYKF